VRFGDATLAYSTDVKPESGTDGRSRTYREAKHLLELHDSGNYTRAELAELFGVGRSTVYRTIERILPKPPEPERPFAHLAQPQV
jgi:Helix-turn-helix domain of resolvase